MSLFTKIHEIAQDAVLTMTFAANKENGTLTVTVIPKAVSDKANPALATPLSFEATPEELDVQFADALGRFQASRKSLADAVKDVEAVMAAAAKEATSKASKAVKNASERQTTKTPPEATATLPSQPEAAPAATAPVDSDSLFA